MPIQIQCPSCGQALRVPETAIGKTVRCPKCQTTFAAAASDTTGSAPAAPTPPATTNPFPPAAANPFDFGTPPAKPAASDPFAGFGSGNPSQPAGGNPFGYGPQSNAPVNPYSSPSTGAPTSSGWNEFGGVGEGLPWEQSSSPSSYIATIKLVLLESSRAFPQMRTSGDITSPLFYYWISTFVSGFGALIWIIPMFAIVAANNGEFRFSPVGTVVQTGVQAVMSPIFLCISAGLIHLAMKMTGAARRKFDVTFRTLCFSYGASNYLTLIPLVGPLLTLGWSLVATIIGLSRTHQTDSGRVVLSMVLSMVLCCGMICGFYLAIGAIFFAIFSAFAK